MAIKCPKCNTDNSDTQKFCGECATPLQPSKDNEVTETIEAPKEELTRGAILANRYEIIEELGKGGMGRVYRVEDTKLKQEVALKLIKPEIAKDRKTIERFRNELKLARNIRHKNVCGMFDFGEAEGAHFITMEYIRGENLKSFIHRSGQLAVGTAVRIAKQVCEGLSEAHKLGIVHRDLKSNNIMIDKEGNARIMDFGIARSLEAKEMTGAGVIIGTPEYMSPEQVEGKEVDQRSDIYSFGVILYEMVTGNVPFHGETPFVVGMKQKTEMPSAPQELNTQIPFDLNHLILKCIEKDKEKRWQTVEQVLVELERVERSITTTKKIIREEELDTTMKGEVEWKNSVAVLPFADLSPQKDQDYFCEGIAEELINGFSKIEKLRVASRTSSFQFKDRGYDITEVGKKLKVQYVLEGSVRKSGNRLRITAQLVNANDGYHLWSEKYDRDLEDIFTIQDEISLAIVKELKIKLLGEEKAALLKRYTENKEAYSAYLKGLYFWNRRSEVGFEKALTFYRQAIEIDPLYAFPYIGIADTYNVAGHFCFLPPKDAFAKAHAAASKALEIDETIGEAHASMGWLFTYSDWNWELAESEFKQAIELSPNYATGHEWYALFLMDMGRFDKAIREIKKALELDPISSMINAVGGIVYLCSRQYDKAVEQFLKTIELDPSFPWAYQWLGLAYGAKQIYDKATKSLEKAASLAKDMPFGLGLLGMAYGWAGQKNEAKRVLEKLDSLSDKKYVSLMHKTFVYIGLEERNKVFEYLDKAYTEKDPMLVYAKVGPWMDYCRSDPRYDALLEKMRFKA